MPYFLREAGRFIADYLSWAWHDQSAKPSEKAVTVGKVLLVLFAVYYLAAFFIFGLAMIFAPLEYDWLEGAHLAQIHRWLSGEPLYAAPSLAYVSLLYEPLFANVSAAVACFFGESYPSIRFVSFSAVIGTEAMLCALVWRETRSGFAALLAAGFYAGMFGVVHFYYAMARVDALSCRWQRRSRFAAGLRQACRKTPGAGAGFFPWS